MASFTQVVKRKRSRRRRNAGHARKQQMSRKSTLSYDELFEACGAPGKAPPKSAAQAKKSG